MYYWRNSDPKLELSRWRGPGLICSMQPRGDDSHAGPRPSVYWIAHGNALVRAAPEHVRAETPREYQARLQRMPQTARVADVETTVRAALRPVRGPIRFLDLSGDPPFAHATAPNSSVEAQEEPTAQTESTVQQALEAPTDENEQQQQQSCEPQQQPDHFGSHAAAAEQHTAAAEQHAAAAGQAAAATAATATENVNADEEMNESRKRGKSNEDDGERPHKVEKTKDEAPHGGSDAVRSRRTMTRDDRALAFQSYTTCPASLMAYLPCSMMTQHFTASSRLRVLWSLTRS